MTEYVFLRGDGTIALPFICKACQLLLEGPFILGTPPRPAPIITGIAVKCPFCEGRAEMIPGIFGYLDGVLGLARAEDFNRAVLNAMMEVVQAHDPLRRERKMAALELRHPKAASSLREWVRDGMAVASLLVACLGFAFDMIDRGSNSGPDAAIVDFAHEELQRQRDGRLWELDTRRRMNLDIDLKFRWSSETSSRDVPKPKPKRKNR